MDIYVLICEDRHIDVFVRVFSSLNIAIAYAEDFMKNNARFPEEIQHEKLSYGMQNDGWVYYATYSSEEDSVRIEKGKIVTTYPQ
jgi:hypothetical protein